MKSEIICNYGDSKYKVTSIEYENTNTRNIKK
jgi:hypothetical protein